MPRPLGLYNAGCTPSLGRFRVFAHAAGRLCGAPGWLVARDRSARIALPAIDRSSPDDRHGERMIHLSQLLFVVCAFGLLLYALQLVAVAVHRRSPQPHGRVSVAASPS